MAGFFLGWSLLWFMWVVTAVADIIAIVGYLRVWWPRPASLDSGARRHWRTADPEPGIREELRRNRVLVLHD